MRLNVIDKETTREEVLEAYRRYPDTNEKGIEAYHLSTVAPIFCEIPKGSKVLDIGCNSGELIKILKEEKNCDVTGIDVSETAIDLAVKKGLNVSFGDAENLKFSDGTFDVVIMREVISHIFDRQKALSEVKRVLKSDGIFLGSAPHKNIELNLWDDKAPHHPYYKEDELKKDLEIFEKTYLKVLTGAQFSSGMMMSHMASMPAEFLWKCGGENTKPWEHDLMADKKTLRVWFGPTQPPGDVYYRLTGYGEKMGELRDTEIGWERFSYEHNTQCYAWQSKLLLDRESGELESALAVDDLYKCLTVANPWVFQLTQHEEVLGFLEMLKLKHPEKKIVTESDDWIFDVPSYNVASNPYKPNSEKEQIADGQLKLSDALIVSTSYLKERYKTLYPDKKVYVIPNSIDFDYWEKAKPLEGFKPKGKNVVRIIYSGCGNHSGDLKMIKPVLLDLLEEFQNLEVVMSSPFECFEDVKHPRFLVSDKWVSIKTFPSLVKSWDGDIGIAPLRDNDFNRAKSNLRWLEYSALKLPTVMSHVRPFTESVVHNKTGLLCKSKQDWYKALKELIRSREQRERLGNSAYRDVKRNFNMDIWAKKYRGVLEEIKCS